MEIEVPKNQKVKGFYLLVKEGNDNKVLVSKKMAEDEMSQDVFTSMII